MYKKCKICESKMEPLKVEKLKRMNKSKINEMSTNVGMCKGNELKLDIMRKALVVGSNQSQNAETEPFCIK
jgi:hypothetical protein